uniref:Aldedh domain-containing protein n=1 Tax=Macrostomum lignano TaxID=282301 RepID=A0A1I8GLL8_9PLAT
AVKNGSATQTEFQANVEIYSGIGPTKFASYAPNGSVVLETAPGNLTEELSNETQRLTVVFTQNPPFSFFSEGRVRGICVDILDLLSPLLNL